MADDAAPSVENTPFPFERARARYPPSQDSEPAVEPDIFRFQEPAALSEAESSARVQGAPALSERYTAGFDLAARHAQRVRRLSPAFELSPGCMSGACVCMGL